MDSVAGAYAEGVQKLSEIWNDVLGKSPQSVTDDFFRAGGDSSAAIRLFDQIGVRFGRSIPPLAIYTAPTISSLAQLLLAGEPARFSNAVLLAPGPPKPPVFLIHGLGGHVMEFSELLRWVDWPCPIYGLQARGTDGLETPLDRIESMADYHIDAITRIQSSGPYFLCGYSLGGLVALEIARRLLQSCRTVGFLSMLDSYPHARFLPRTERLRLHCQRARNRIVRADTQGHQELETLGEKICGPALRGVGEKARQALQAYRPQSYRGDVVFFRAQITTVFPADPQSAWRLWIPGLKIETVPGDHHSMLRQDAKQLASALSRRLNAAFH